MELLYKNIERNIYSFYTISFNEYNSEELEENKKIIIYQRIKLIKFLMAVVTILKNDNSITKESFKLKFTALIKEYIKVFEYFTADYEMKKIEDEICTIFDIVQNDL